MFDIEEKNFEDLLSKEDLAKVKECGAEMDRAAGGKIAVSSLERDALSVTSPALLEQEKETSKGRG